MPIPTYTLGYPPDGSSLGQTKSTIRNNLDGTFETLAVDHINNNGQPGSQPAGYHTIIHQVPQTSVNTVSGYNQVFSGVPSSLVVNGVAVANIPSNNDTQLYCLTGMGGLSQLTGASTSNVTNCGYQWVGGVLLQWGFKSTTGTSGSIDFTANNNVKFPNYVFNVQLSSSNNAGSPQTNTVYNIVETSLTTMGFNWVSNNANGQKLYWFAIGK
jgi:hypothetical protein